MINTPEIAEFKRFISYNPDTGVMTWKEAPSNNTKKGARCTPKPNEGAGKRPTYLRIMFKNRLYAQHRVAWLLMTGKWPETNIDHINRDSLDNRWVNLRLASKAQNCQNASKYRTKSPTSKYIGVSRAPTGGKWIARITAHGKTYMLGRFTSEVDAAQAYNAAAKSLHGDFAVTNKAPEGE